VGRGCFHQRGWLVNRKESRYNFYYEQELGR
jgi:hypothetical protein